MYTRLFYLQLYDTYMHKNFFPINLSLSVTELKRFTFDQINNINSASNYFYSGFYLSLLCAFFNIFYPYLCIRHSQQSQLLCFPLIFLQSVFSILYSYIPDSTTYIFYQLFHMIQLLQLSYLKPVFIKQPAIFNLLFSVLHFLHKLTRLLFCHTSDCSVFCICTTVVVKLFCNTCG